MVNPAGGVRYHWRARRHARRWRPFTAPLAQWLDAWRPEADRLLLIGPSAGWCLPDALFLRFARLDVLEPDPLARLLLARRLRGLGREARTHAGDYLTGAPDRLAQLGRDFPAHAILFCNLLGQLRFLHPELDDPARARRWKDALATTLDGRAWATFHDRLSGRIAPRLAGTTAASDVGLDDDALVAAFYAGDGELVTHGTEHLFPARPRRYFAWELVPGRHHLVEAVRHA